MQKKTGDPNAQEPTKKRHLRVRQSTKMRRTSHLSKLVIISPALQRFFPIYEHTKVAAKKWIWLRSHEKTMMAMGNKSTSQFEP